MLQNWFKENKLLIIVAGVLFLCLAIGWILYALFGHQLIEAMYEGRSIGFLNRIITGSAKHPIELYFEDADRIFSMAFMLGSAVALILVLLITISGRNQKTNEICILGASILIFFFLAQKMVPFVPDDAYISFRYAENLVANKSITFNPSEHPVEGLPVLAPFFYMLCLEWKPLCFRFFF